MTGRRRALLVVTNDYSATDFDVLSAPAEDARRLGAVLADPEIGGFEVEATLVDESSQVIAEAVEDFFAGADPADLLLLYFSGHARKDSRGSLYFALSNTRTDRLVSTGVSAVVVRDLIDWSRSKSVIVWLDCCVGGAFPAAQVPKGDDDLSRQLDPGRGCYVMAAATAIQPAYEDTTDPTAPFSVFTDAIVAGLATGAADLDADGVIRVGELFDFVSTEMARRGAMQTPTRSDQGAVDPMVAWNRRVSTVPAIVPAEVRTVLLRGTPDERRVTLRGLALVAAHGGDRAVLDALARSPDTELAALVVSIEAEVAAETDWRILSGAVLESAREEYLRWLVGTHGQLRMAGLRHGAGVMEIPLNHLYVALRVDQSSATERAAAHELVLRDLDQRLRLADLTPEEEQLEWWMAQAELPIADHFARGACVGEGRLLNVGELCALDDAVVVLGNPGSGKTTIARWLTLVHAGALLDGRAEVTVPLEKVDAAHVGTADTFTIGVPLLPVLARVAEFAERLGQLREDSFSVLDFLAEHTWFGVGPRWSTDVGPHREGDALPVALRKEVIRSALSSGRGLVVLDGLDEVSGPDQRTRVSEAVVDFVRWATTRGNTVIVTSRVAGYHLQPLPASLAHVTIQGLTDDSLSVFLHSWMREVRARTATADGPTDASFRADRLLALLRDPSGRRVRELATNPLLATTIATIFEAGNGTLPRQRVEVYQKAIDRLVEIWHVRMSGADIARLREHMFTVLRHVAYHIHRCRPSGVIAEPEFRDIFRQELARLRPDSVEDMLESLLRVMRDEVGLMVASAPGAYRFSHQTFQEYVAAQYLLDRPALILRHVGDPRWREPLLMVLGLVNWRHPSRFPGLVAGLLADGGVLGNRFPESALLLADAMSEMTSVDGSIVRTVLETLLDSHRTLTIEGRLGHVRELVEGAIGVLRAGEHQDLVDEILVESLVERGAGPWLAATTARLVLALDVSSPRVLAALVDAAPYNDCADLGHPVAEAVGVMVARVVEATPGGMVDLPGNHVRSVLSRSPALVDRIRGDRRWHAVVLAVFGGVADLGTRGGLHQYIRMANYLQLDEVVRDGFTPYFGTRWGREDPVYAMAVHLDTKGKSVRDRHARPPRLSASAIVRNSVLSRDLLTTLARGDYPGFLARLDSAAPSPDVHVARWAAGGDLPDDDTVQDRIGALATSLRDGVLRSGSLVQRALWAAASRLDSAGWGRLAEATLAILLHAGAEPVVLESPDLPRSHRHRAMVEDMAHRFRGWGDDSRHHAAVYADAHQQDVEVLVAALYDAGSARHSTYSLYTEWWPADRLVFPRDRGEIPVAVFDLLSRVPQNFAIARTWMLQDVIAPMVARAPGHLPEAIALAAAVVDGKVPVCNALDAGMLGADDPAAYVFAKAADLDDPWLRARAFARIAELFPDHRSAGVAAAAEAAARVDDPRRGFELHEWLSRLAGQDHVAACALARSALTDPVEKALATLRLARISPADRYVGLVAEAVAVIGQVEDQAEQARLLGLVADDHEVVAAVGDAVAGLARPVDRAYAVGAWGTVVFEHLPSLPSEDAEVWTLLSVYGRAVEVTTPRYVVSEPAEVRAIDRALSTSPRADLADRLARLRHLSPDTEPTVARWLEHPDPTVSGAASLLVAEYRGLTVDFFDDVFDLLGSDFDLMRYRAQHVFSSSMSPYRCLSTMGLDLVTHAVQRGHETKDIDPGVAQAVVRLSDTVAMDHAGTIDRLCDLVETGDHELPSAGLRLFHQWTTPVWERLLHRLATGTPQLRAALLLAIGVAAHRGYDANERKWLARPDEDWRLTQARWDQVWRFLPRIDRTGLESIPLRSVTHAEIMAVVAESAAPDVPVDVARCELATRTGRTLADLLVGDESTVLSTLIAVGATFRARPRPPREAVEAVMAGEYAGRPWVDLLVRWTGEELTTSVNDGPDDLRFLRCHLLELLADAADLNRDTFRRVADVTVMKRVLAETLRFSSTFPARACAAQLLGILRTGSEDVLGALLGALSDVTEVRLAAIESIPKLKDIDQAVVDRLVRSLHHPSATTAWAAAQLLTAVGRSAALTDSLRGGLVTALADATLDPRSHRTIHFAYSVSAIPDMPQLDDAFADALRVVYGFEWRRPDDL